jgi:hypothetical protein
VGLGSHRGQRAIAAAAGVSKDTVRNIRSAGDNSPVQKTIGLDGGARPARRTEAGALREPPKVYPSFCLRAVIAVTVLREALCLLLVLNGPGGQEF